MTITYADFLQTAADNHGEVLPTAGGQKTFILRVEGDKVLFEVSTGGIRWVNQASAQRYLDIYNRTQSTKTSTYVQKMHAASYVLTVVRLCVGQHLDAPLLDERACDGGANGPEYSAAEGERRFLLHSRGERSRELVRIAKDRFRQVHGRFFCEVCTFDFDAAYGDPDFIEAHHRIPLRDLQPGMKTKPSDLAMVCANCHRMLHRGDSWPTISELRKRMVAKPR